MAVRNRLIGQTQAQVCERLLVETCACSADESCLPQIHYPIKGF